MYNFVKITTKINDFNGHIQGRGGLYSPKGKKTRERDIYTMTKNHGFKKTSDTVKSTLSYMRYCLAKKNWYATSSKWDTSTTRIYILSISIKTMIFALEEKNIVGELLQKAIRDTNKFMTEGTTVIKKEKKRIQITLMVKEVNIYSSWSLSSHIKDVAKTDNFKIKFKWFIWV